MQGFPAKRKRVALFTFGALILVALASTCASRTTNQAFPAFEDWTTHHVVYARFGYLPTFDAVARDPRAWFEWRRHADALRFQHSHHGPTPLPPYHRRASIQRDWSIYLGAAGTAKGMYPAKFSFNVNATPSCANDFIVFPIAAAGSSTQPNLVAFINLYSGTAGGNGICNRTASASDTGVAATVSWSYNIQALSGGSVTTSPVISYDVTGGELGTKVAFVESATGSAAHFHVLAFKSGDGQNASNLQSVLTPKTISTFVTSDPVDGSGTATDLALGSAAGGTDTLSSPFVDYSTDKAYVGNDLGVLYRIKDVFCLSTNPDCTGGTKPAPSLDATWGTGGAITVCSGALTAPVLDYVTYNIYVGCADGKLYSVSQAGVIKSIVVGDGVASKTYGAIVEPPIVDSVNGFVYAVSGSANNGAYGALVQAPTSLASSVTAQIGAGNQCNIHAPALNNTYYTSPTTSGALIYVGGVTGTVSQPCSASSSVTGGDIFLYGVTFGSGGVLTSGTPTDSFNCGGGPGSEWVSLLEYYNATTSTDWLFLGALQSSQTNVASVNITTAFPTGFTDLTTEGLGQSGMIVDNDANTTTYPQAASIYFNALGENAACTNNTVLTDTGGCAVKLTQAALQ